MTRLFEDDMLHDECGVVAIVAPGRDVSRLTFYALHALQHRGQESAGIAVAGGGQVTVQRDMGLVSAVFDEPALRSLVGDIAIGHVRYSTTGGNHWENAQPVARQRGAGIIALGHNGNLTNTDALRERCVAAGDDLVASTDSEIIAALIAGAPGDLFEATAVVMPDLVGAFSAVVMSESEAVAFRDPDGVRPLVLGRIGEHGHCVVSESCALDQIGAEFIRDVRPGEVVRLSRDGVESRQVVASVRRSMCVFEHIYFARPDTNLEGVSVWEARHRMGTELAREAPAEVDLVVGLPDSGTPAAIGFSAYSGVPYAEAVVRNRYVGRSFIQPDQGLRQQGIRLKFNPLRSVIEGKRLVVVDDSIVRGNTVRQTVQMLFDQGGAAEVHLRISSPPIAWPCFYGIDMPNRRELVAATMTLDEIVEMSGATSLAYLSLDGLERAVGRPAGGFCRACFTGDYPIPVPADSVKLRFEPAAAAR